MTEKENPIVNFFGMLFMGAVFLGVVCLALWMTGFFGLFGGSTMTTGAIDDFTPPEPETVWNNPEPPTAKAWSCGWSPTMNENWHDDVLCTNGVDQDRPILLPDWSYVTKDDMMAEARNYENYLNSR